jgi:hypothetical protein
MSAKQARELVEAATEYSAAQGALQILRMKIIQVYEENEQLRMLNKGLMDTLKLYQLREDRHGNSSRQKTGNDIPPSRASRNDDEVDAERYLLTAGESEAVG